MIRTTSIESYNKIREGSLLSERRLQVYEVLFEHGPMTANELFRILMGKTTITQSNIHARLNEMREMGCVREIGKRECSVTNNKVILWDVTDSLPEKLKEKNEDCPHCDGTGKRLIDGETKS